MTETPKARQARAAAVNLLSAMKKLTEIAEEEGWDPALHRAIDEVSAALKEIEDWVGRETRG